MNNSKAETAMVKTWNTGVGEDFVCPHCGALYTVSIMRLPVRERVTDECVVCKRVMFDKNTTEQKSFSLKSKPA